MNSILSYIRYIFRLVGTFIYRFRLLILLGIVIGVISYVLLINLGGKLFLPTEKIGVVGRYRVEDLPQSILHEIGDGLTALDKSNEPQGAIADQWEALDDGKTWEFKIRGDVTWQDDTKVTSGDINYEFEGLETQRPDAQTLIFKLPEIFAPFPAVVSRPVFKSGLLGTGGWKVQNIRHTSGIISELRLLSIDEKFKKIYKFYPTEEDAIVAFKLGEINKLQNIVNTEEFNGWPTVELDQQEDPGAIVTIFFNNLDPFLSDKSIRQALAYALDKQDLGGERAISPIAKNSWVYNPQVKDYLHDTDRANELLEEVDESLEKKIDLTTTSSLLPVAEKVAEYWREVGVEVQIHVSPTVPTEFQAFLTIFEPPLDPDQYTLWHSTQTGTNITKLNNSRIDKLLEDGRLELDRQERRKIYLDFQRFIVEESPAIFLYNPTLTTVTKKR